MIVVPVVGLAALFVWSGLMWWLGWGARSGRARLDVERCEMIIARKESQIKVLREEAIKWEHQATMLGVNREFREIVERMDDGKEE